MMIGNKVIFHRYNEFYKATTDFSRMVWRKKKLTMKGIKRALRNDGIDYGDAMIVRIEYQYWPID